MRELNDRQYYISRAAAARQRASTAIDLKIAAIHAEMAEQYDLLASTIGEPPTIVMRSIGRD